MPSRTTRRRGFTLTELLIAIAIIAVLIGIVGVVVSKARGTADRFRLNGQLQAIAVGLEAYKADFQGYPIPNLDNPLTPAQSGPGSNDDLIALAGARGARTLCKALMGPCPQGDLTNTTATTATFDLARPSQDGNNGLGFRVTPRSGAFQFDQSNPAAGQPRQFLAGKVYGPYLSESQFKMSRTDAAGALVAGTDYDDTTVLLDANGQPILYYALLNAQASVAAPNTFIGPTPDPAYTAVTTVPMYRATDNSAWLPADAFRRLLGDADLNGGIGTGETAAVKGKFILWSSGPDGLFGPRNATGQIPTDPTEFGQAVKARYDDVTNFQE